MPKDKGYYPVGKQHIAKAMQSEKMKTVQGLNEENLPMSQVTSAPAGKPKQALGMEAGYDSRPAGKMTSGSMKPEKSPRVSPKPRPGVKPVNKKARGF